MTTNKEVAEAFSGHRFDEATGHLAEHVSWVSPGGPTIDGRAAVIAACEATIAQLAGVSTDFPRFLTVVGEDAVVVDAIARYSGPDGTFVVSSCDIYEFDAGEIVRITSYVTELPAG